MFITYHKKSINLSREYSFFKSAVNCIIHHPYLKIFRNEYCYVESERIIDRGYYSHYERFHMLLSLLWNSIKQKDIQNIIDCYYNILGELNIFNNSGICDYYGNDNFYKIDLVCYVRKSN